MQRPLAAALGALALLAPAAALSQAPAQQGMAATAKGPACVAPAEPARAGIRFFMGIQPSDGLLDVWCRIQALQGKKRVNVWFPETNAHRTFETVFDGTPSKPREELARFVQSLLPTDREAPATDEAGMPFPAVLAKTYQGLAPRTPDGQGLGLPAAYPGARSLALWEPVILRIRPLMIADREFSLSILLKPQVGRLVMALQGQAEQFVLRGAKSRLVPYSGGGQCPADRIPSCEAIPEVADIQTAWVVDAVKLEADGGGLSGATRTLFESLASSDKAYVYTNNMRRFSETVGTAELQLKDGVRQVDATAEGDPKRVAGTRTVKVVWHEIPNSEGSYASALRTWTTKEREAFVLRYVTPQAQSR